MSSISVAEKIFVNRAFILDESKKALGLAQQLKPTEMPETLQLLTQLTVADNESEAFVHNLVSFY